MTQSSRIIFISMKTGMEIHENFPDIQRWKLDEGGVVKSQIQGKNYNYYRIIGIEDDEYSSKVYLKRIPLYKTEILKLLILAVLAWFVFNAWWQILVG